MALVVGLALLLSTLSPEGAEARSRHHHHRHHRHHHHRNTHHHARRMAVVAFVKRQVGKPYVWGATGPWSFDCSGLAVAAYRHIGIYLPRTTYAQLASHRLHVRHRLRLGDLVYRSNHHMGVYIGHHTVIHAPHTGARVRRIGLWYFNHRRSVW